MVTAEFAAAMPAFVLMLFVGIGAVGAVASQLRCEHAAYLAAREAARGGTEAAAPDLPDNARLEVVRRNGRVSATVRATVEILGTRLPGISVSGRVVAALERGAPDEGMVTP
ncbi:MAG: TadE family type IV pilus minor pilin [Pseudonocardiaceae bacterium]